MIEGGLSARFAVNQETPLAAHPADVRKAQEVEGLGLAEAPLPVLLMGEPAKADQPGLVGVECETERLRAFGDLAPEARGIVRLNGATLSLFCTEVRFRWYRALCRRSQRKRLNCERFGKFADHWIPKARIVHPYPYKRFDAKYSRVEPDALAAPVRICAGGAE